MTYKKKQRVWVWLSPEELETLDDIARIANLPKVRAEQIRFTIRMFRWTYASELGRLIDEVKTVLTELKKTLEESKNEG